MTGLAGFDAAVVEPVAAPLVGHRTWRLSAIGALPRGPMHALADAQVNQMRGALHGIYLTSYRWGSGPNKAVCLRVRTPGVVTHPADPMARQHRELVIPQSCGCGFWAYGAGVTVPVGRLELYGAIQGWGRIIAGPRGFRAERARIVGLVLPPRPRPLRRPKEVRPEWLTADMEQAIRRAYPSVRFFASRVELRQALPPSPMVALVGEERHHG